MCVVGEAGIGKSALAEDFAAEARRAGARVAVGRAWELGDAPPYFPVWPCLAGLGLAVPPEPTPEGGFVLWQEVLSRLSTSGGPWVWVVEDVHAADDATLDLLLFLGRTIRALRAVVLATVRPGAVEARLAREAARLTLGPLTEDESRALARAVGHPEGPRLDAVVARTGGNPLFVELAARGGGEGALAEVTRARVRALPEGTQTALAAAAVLGRELRAGPLARMMGVLPAMAVGALGPALDAGLLRESEPGRFVFVHAVVAEVLRDGLPRAERARLHAAAARSLPEDGAASVVRRADHAMAALEAGATDAPSGLVEDAVRWLARQGAPGGAWALARRVVLARDNGLLAAASPTELVRAAGLALAAGSHVESADLSTRAFDLARALADGEAAAAAALASGAVLHPGHVDEALVARLTEARCLVGDDAVLGARLDARLAAARQPSRDPSGPVELARRALAQSVGAPDHVRGEILLHAGSALSDYAPDEEVAEVAGELRAVSVRLDDAQGLLRAAARAAFAALALGDVARFDDAVDEALHVARRVGHPRLAWRPLLLASMRATARGDLALADRLLAEAESFSTVTDDPALAPTLLAHQFQRALALGDDASVRSALAGADRIAPRSPLESEIRALATAIAAARLGDPARAAASLAALPFAHVLRHATSYSHRVLAEAYALAGTDDQRRALRALLARRPTEHLTTGHVPMSYEGPAARVVALLDRALGDVDAALAGLLRAKALAAEGGFAPWEARIDVELALLHRERGDKVDGAAEAVARCEALGLPGLARPLHVAPARQARPTETPTARFVREGDVTLVAWGDRATRVRTTRGVELLARLVGRPREEVHVLTLASDADGELTESTAGEALDPEAIRAYRARLRVLARELTGGDLPDSRRDALRREAAALEHELSRAVGLGGRPRKAASLAERARVNVQRRIKDALLRIREADAAIGEHLDGAVRTGTFCTYRP